MIELLKFITCGSVDDGKSTLIGHMLYDAKLLFADQENSLILDSKVKNRDTVDYSLLLDGLSAEREQGITIDVAYRYFHTERRSFIVADTPGHEEYTRNMAVGASFADLAIILVDATKGLLPQTRRHIRICSLMGISHFVFAINKMDLVYYDNRYFDKIVHVLQVLMAQVPCVTCEFIPVSATRGDNVTKLSPNMPWYTGRVLLEYLEKIELSRKDHKEMFLLPIQNVCRPHRDFRGFQGQVVKGELAVGEEIIVLPSENTATIKQLFMADQEVTCVQRGQPVTVVFEQEVDCSRGCVIVSEKSLQTSRLLRCDLLWMDDEELLVGRNYLIKLGTRILPATVFKIHYCIDVNTGEHILQEKASKNDIINCDISLSEKIAVDDFNKCAEMGRFILINRITNMTSACGVVKHTLRRSDNLTWQTTDVTREIRANQKTQIPKTFWFTGLSGSGKSTIANALERALVSMGKHTMILDGDNVRMGLNNDLGFTPVDRVENIRRMAEMAKLMNDAGLIVLVSAISPFEADRENTRKILGEAYFEVYVQTSLSECERRDTKNLYKKARKGEISNFTGISSPYEVPKNPDFVADTESDSIDDIVKRLLST